MADIVIRALAHTMRPDSPRAGAVAIADGRILDTSPAADGLDALIGPRTTVVEHVTVLPAFADTHNHLLHAARDSRAVPVGRAATIAEFVALVADRAANTAPGEWVRTAAGWHEIRLAEGRLPTALELDRASTAHPIIAPRGGHNAVLSSAALRAVGIDRDTADIPGGLIARDAAGNPTGWLQDAALDVALRRIPPLEPAELVAGLGTASADYAAVGLGVIRDAAVTPTDWTGYRTAEAQGILSVRAHAMLLLTPPALANSTPDGYLDSLVAQGIHPGAGMDRLRVWGLKLILDGGVEAAALAQPYASRPDYRGELLWEAGELTALLRTAARRDWPIGMHAFGDRAIDLALDAIAATEKPGGFAIEHGGLISAAQRRRAAALGVHVTVQQPLLLGLSGALRAEWGAERTAALFPWRELLADGVAISAGSDHPIGPLNPLLAVHSMVTRATPAGVFGAGHAIDRAEALRLYTAAAAPLLHAHHGQLVPGAPADLVAFPTDPLACPIDELPELRPAFTLLAGRPTHVAAGFDQGIN